MSSFSLIGCATAGIGGYLLSRSSTLLFPQNLGGPQDRHATNRVAQVINRINQLRIEARKKLDKLSSTNRTYHFVSTSIKDNLGIVFFLLTLTAQGVKSATISPSPTPEEDPFLYWSAAQLHPSIRGLIAPEVPEAIHQYVVRESFKTKVFICILSNMCIEPALSNKPDTIISIAVLTIVSCGIMHLVRAGVFTMGNRLLSQLQGSSLPSPAMTAARHVLTCLAPSEL